MLELTKNQFDTAGETTQEQAEGALYFAIATTALKTEDAQELYILAQAFDTIAGKDDTPEPPDKSIHSTESATMLESRFWDEGSRVCGFTPRGLPKSKYRYKEGPEKVV